MKTLQLAGAAALALGSLVTSVSAADLRVEREVVQPVMAPFLWHGFYIGAHAGYGFGGGRNVVTTGQSAINVTNVAGGARPPFVGLSPEGFVGGVQMGYNWQFGAMVLGFETDISYTDLRRTRTVVTTALNGVDQLNNTFRQELEYLGTVRGRLGYSFDRTLLYVTGGLAYGGIDNSGNFFGQAGQLQFSGRNRRTEVGYTVGGGLEHAFAGNWSAKIEYLYYDLGRDTVNVAFVPGGGGGGTGYNSTFRNDGHIVRAGLNYRFGGMAGGAW